MSVAARLDRHAALVHDMAEALNLDLAEKTLRGELPGSEFRSILFNCLACDKPGECREFLVAHKTGAGAPPSYCRNRDRLAQLGGA